MKRLLFASIFLFLTGHVYAQPSSALVAEAESGYLLIKENASEELPPASLTKVMTLYLTFGALEKGWLKLEDRLPISAHAASQPRTNLNLQTGQTITVKEAILSLIVHSANDAAVVLAESMAPNETEFANMMTQTASMLNMSHTVFKNASGLHAEGQKTTAQDMAILTLAVIKHYPEYYPLFATTSFDFNGRTYKSHNRVLNEYEGAEGFKTGYVSAVGYNIISTAQKDNVRLVGVVLGKETSKERDQLITNLLDRGFQKASVQRDAVANGQINPAFDPLHRRALLQKVNLDLFSASMKRQIAQAKSAASILKKSNSLNQKTKQSENFTFAENGWTIQVGAFQSKKRAEETASYALALLGQNSIQAVTDQKNSLFKAKLTGFLDKKLASDACKFLESQACSCFVINSAIAQGDQ